MLTIDPIPAFSDNYIWLLYDPDSREAFVVDPGDAAPVVQRLQEMALQLTGILITHHHFDHTGGLEQLRTLYSPVVYGPANPSINGIDERVAAGDKVQALGKSFDIIEVPGHTLDHIAYYHDAPTPLLFCGDTLFAGGCGRVFEGTPPMMHQSLQSLAALPAATRIYCAHEYTLANLAFACAVEPDNEALSQRLTEAEAARARNEPTVPSSIELEMATNPFLRCAEPALLDSLRNQGRLAGSTGPEVFATVRGWKDNF
jgi:hydroxyacylglutathione hydrolase